MKKLLICSNCIESENFKPFENDEEFCEVKSCYSISKVKCNCCGKNIKRNDELNCVAFGRIKDKHKNWTEYLIKDYPIEPGYTLHGPSKRELRLIELKNKYKGLKYNPYRSRFY